MRAALLVALLIFSAGCLGGADTNPKNDPRPTPTPDPTPGPTPSPTPGTPPGRVIMLADFAFTGCRGIEAQYQVSASAAQALLPEGFTVRADQGPTADQALARYRLLACPQFTAPGIAINETIYGDVSLLIDDPAIEASGEREWYRFRVFSADDNLAAAWSVSGYDVVTGGLSLSTSPLLQRTASFEGYEAQWFDTLDDGVPAGEVSFTATPAGTLVWSETVDETAAVKLGIGTFSVPSDDPLSSLLGSDPSKLRLLSHTGTDASDALLVLVRST